MKIIFSKEDLEGLAKQHVQNLFPKENVDAKYGFNEVEVTVTMTNKEPGA